MTRDRVSVTPAGQIVGEWVPPMAGVVGGLVGLVVTVLVLFLVEQLWRLTANGCITPRTWSAFKTSTEV